MNRPDPATLPSLRWSPSPWEDGGRKPPNANPTPRAPRASRSASAAVLGLALMALLCGRATCRPIIAQALLVQVRCSSTTGDLLIEVNQRKLHQPWLPPASNAPPLPPFSCPEPDEAPALRTFRGLSCPMFCYGQLIAARTRRIQACRGNFPVVSQVHPEWAPLGAVRFLELVRDGKGLSARVAAEMDIRIS